MSNVTNKIQVLVSDEDISKLNTILTLEALKNENKPLPLSTFVRNIIKDYIKSYPISQKSFVSNIVKKHIREFKENK